MRDNGLKLKWEVLTRYKEKLFIIGIVEHWKKPRESMFSILGGFQDQAE